MIMKHESCQTCGRPRFSFMYYKKVILRGVNFVGEGYIDDARNTILDSIMEFKHHGDVPDAVRKEWNEEVDGDGIDIPSSNGHVYTPRREDEWDVTWIKRKIIANKIKEIISLDVMKRYKEKLTGFIGKQIEPSMLLPDGMEKEDGRDWFIIEGHRGNRNNYYIRLMDVDDEGKVKINICKMSNFLPFPIPVFTVGIVEVEGIS